MIGGKITLTTLKHVRMEAEGEKGPVQGIFIPIEANHLFVGAKDKGSHVYMDIIAFDLNEPKEHQTHLVKQSLPKEVRDAMSDDEKNEQPIIGSLNTNISGGGEKSGDAAGGKTVKQGGKVPF